ncbi:cytochrome b/b6 domain-containing protein [Longimicrobium sp.]|uniref:cytochrome b/b6 domain-containing protein n=1 Tax=Longimicrobium sp. TaxID=2029185 RepID=UPI002C0A9419|nr:cytochrome b/b6 domain-containing protein [Longimicrobium sp.]HSU17710.1 cytochrome b/b6 domain-containing protein [Longimicrobium sp.]
MHDSTAHPDAPRETRRHHWIVRATHWVNVVALTLMVGSGLRIFNAYPAFARKGEAFCCWPWEGHAIPGWLTFGGWLAGARNWHFAMMWVLAVNGAIYLAFIWLHGEWRDLAPRRGDPRDAWEMIKFYLFVRKTHPRQGKHNALQKGVYFALPWLGVLAVLTGLAIWKPVQLAPLTGLFGGYVWARYWHFLVMLTLVLLGLGHVFMVFAVDPASLPSMITGRYDESRSPEALNARPFLRGRPKPVLAIARPAPAPKVVQGDADGDRDVRPSVTPAPVVLEDGDRKPAASTVSPLAVPGDGDAGPSVPDRPAADGDAQPAAIAADRRAAGADAGDADQPAADARESGKEAGR